MDRTAEPSEEEQFEAYATVVKAMNGKEVMIRTLDIGGDKNIPYLEMGKEDNPFLWTSCHPLLSGSSGTVFAVRSVAILRASAYGNVKIMLPLVTMAQEITKARQLIEACTKELRESVGKTVRESTGRHYGGDACCGDYF